MRNLECFTPAEVVDNITECFAFIIPARVSGLAADDRYRLGYAQAMTDYAAIIKTACEERDES